MGIFDEQIEKWLFPVALRKVAVIIGKGAAALVAGAVVQGYCTKFGVTVDPEKLQVAATALCLALFESGHDYLKLRFPTVIKF